jgi:hypothetical protein
VQPVLLLKDKKEKPEIKALLEHLSRDRRERQVPKAKREKKEITGPQQQDRRVLQVLT